MKEKVVCENLPQLADFVRLATPLARFGKVDRTATNQKAGSSNPPGRTTSSQYNNGDLNSTGNGRVWPCLHATLSEVIHVQKLVLKGVTPQVWNGRCQVRAAGQGTDESKERPAGASQNGSRAGNPNES
jgi:hypothetical protein